MRKAKKVVSVILTLSMLMALVSGCGGTSAEDKKTEGSTPTEEAVTDENDSEAADAINEALSSPTGGQSDESITVALPTEPNTLVPTLTAPSTESSAVIINLMYETLFKGDYETLEPLDNSLVEKSEQIDDTHFRLTLQEGIKFQNGDDLTTADVLYTFQLGAQGALKGEFGIYDVPNFEVEDDYNIVFATVQPWAQGQERLSFEMFFIVNKNTFETAGGADTTVQYLENAGTGMYKFAEWVPGDHITVTRNDDYWKQDMLPYYKEIKFVFINDVTARGMAVQSGDVDLAIGLDLASYGVYEADATIKPVPLNDNRTNTLFLNSGNGGALSDVRVREALYWCIDKEALKQVGMAGFGEVQDTMISTKAPVWDGVQPVVYEPDYEKAKQLLTDAGYPDGITLKFRVYAVTSVISLLQEQLRQGGIEIDLVLAEAPVHFASLAEGDFDLSFSMQQFAYYTEPVRCTDGINYKYSDVMGGTGYQNEEYTAICERCYSAVDMTERKAAYAELLQHFRENYVSVGLFSGTYLCLTKPSVEGLALRGAGVVDLTGIYGINE